MGMHFERTIVINAIPQAVWDAFADVSQWHIWSGAVTEAAWISGEPWQKGSRLKVAYKLMPLKVESVIEECAPPERVSLSGGTMGITAVSSFTFIAQPDGKTLITASQDLEGGALAMFGDSIRPPLEKTLDLWVNGLKAKLEG